MAEDKKEDKKPDKEAKEGDSPEGAEEGAEGEGGSLLKSKKKLIIIAAAALLLLIIAGVAAFFIFKGKKTHDAAETTEGVVVEGEDGAQKEGAASQKKEEINMPVYLDMADFLVNLNSSGRQTTFLKMQVTLDVPDEKTKQIVEANMPRIRDAFQVYLHELRPEDVRGSAGLQMLREELLLRINRIVYPNKVNDILFKEILVQ